MDVCGAPRNWPCGVADVITVTIAVDVTSASLARYRCRKWLYRVYAEMFYRTLATVGVTSGVSINGLSELRLKVTRR
jgi:hypothetical protein